MQTLLGLHRAWESHPTLPEQDSPVTSTSPDFCTSLSGTDITDHQKYRVGKLHCAEHLYAQLQQVSFILR